MTTQSHAIALNDHPYINQLSKHEGAEVVLKGWLYIKGTVRADSRAPGGYEIDVVDAEVLQQVHDAPRGCAASSTLERLSRFRVCSIASDLKRLRVKAISQGVEL